MDINTMDMSASSPLHNAVAVYTDGGLIGPNPSKLGGTWAYRFVNKEGEVIHEDAGIVTLKEAAPFLHVENNLAEMAAMLRALRILPDGWTGHLYCDNQNTLMRLFRGWSWQKLPPSWKSFATKQLARLGKLDWTLLGGHPSYEEIEWGFRREDNAPVSIHNRRCDEMCTAIAKSYRESSL